jgi:hypothetical protein
MRERALREPHGVQAGEQGYGGGDGGLAGDALGEAIDGEESDGGEDQLCETRGGRAEAGELPPEREIDGGQRRMGVRERGVRNERAGAEEVPGGGDVVAGFVPVVGKAQQREVGEVERDKDERKDQPQGKVAVVPRIEWLPRW